MPDIRPDCPEQSATNSSPQRRHKPNGLAVRLTRDVLLLRSAGSSRRAIAAALNLSQRRVQTILNGAAPGVAAERRPFVMRERDADYTSVEAALRGGSTMRAEHLRYATRCPAPYSYSYFWRRFEDWLDVQPNPRRSETGVVVGPRIGVVSGAIGRPPGGETTSDYASGPPRADNGSFGFPGLPGASSGFGRGRAEGSRDKVPAKLRPQSKIRVSPTNASDDLSAAVNDYGRPERSLAGEPRIDSQINVAHEVGATGGAPLEGGLLFISEPDTALQVRKGALCVRYGDGVERTFPRGRHRVRSIILASPGANVTIEAMRFAIDEGITIFVMHRAGDALAVLTDAPTVDASAHALELRRAQFASAPKQRLEVARAILAMKIQACELSERETQELVAGRV